MKFIPLIVICLNSLGHVNAVEVVATILIAVVRKSDLFVIRRKTWLYISAAGAGQLPQPRAESFLNYTARDVEGCFEFLCHKASI
jgi:hypothetical protein